MQLNHLTLKPQQRMFRPPQKNAYSDEKVLIQ